ncbi:MAG: 1,6-anhydro-N-acetylmuramyl-L-alanine amidase AmpD [Gammaproteobacteria bacterium]|nr:1,6-anhydro-N-acetylmuramyl-L-alanine amidase AmpD [Gammaproteobacteria bacterium]
MFSITDDHWLQGARRVESPNADLRPRPHTGLACEMDLIVLHNISLPAGVFGSPYIDQLFTNQLDFNAHPSFAELRGLEVSSHLLIRRSGEIVQYVAFDRRAWHAGKSNYQGRERCNDFSIGIELEGTDTLPYEDVQYTQLVAVVDSLIKRYPSLSFTGITGHSDIAPGRKTDPGEAFDWTRFQLGLAGRRQAV